MTDHSPSNRRRTVEIPERTARAISERVAGTEFDSVDDYVAFALDQLLRELDRQDGPATLSDSDDRAADEGDEAVAERLESLGYL